MRLTPLATFVLLLVLLLGAVAAARTPAGDAGAERLRRELGRIGTNVERLREPASTTQAQIGIALGELRQMGPATILDPHYFPALVAAARAFVAVSGEDPVTRTAIDPGYLGLEPELAEAAGRLARAATEAKALSARVRKLKQSLAAAKRRARELERQLARR
ncbi:MAG TPA: hypothetical protein VFS26_10140 [Solirubrobacterales bacterium]|nr:hypothetical protein [Solirubrobacterales bacterium]